MTFITSTESDPVTDIDGNIYKTVIIGSQKWMAENLKVTRYNDGTLFPVNSRGGGYENLFLPQYAWYNGDPVYKNIYGALYNAQAIRTNKLCPVGWHAATKQEWIVLGGYVGKYQTAGSLKEEGTIHWADPNNGATNSTGFSALPGGNISNGGSRFITTKGYWWARNEDYMQNSLAFVAISLSNLGNEMFVLSQANSDLLSVRCLKGLPLIPPVSLPEVGSTWITGIGAHMARSGGMVSFSGGADILERGVCWGTSRFPTITDNRTSDGTGIGIFSSILTGLTPDTYYYYRAYATNSFGTAYGSPAYFGTLKLTVFDTPVTDIEGNTYNTVKVGNQIWMAENLRTTQYSDGTPAQVNKYDSYNNDTASARLYGVLYTWNAAMKGTPGSNTNPSGVQGVCPTGWHLPGDEEWKTLSTLFSNGYGPGGKLKEEGFEHWAIPNEDATNESGFTALPGGRWQDGQILSIGQEGYWWSTSSSSVDYSLSSATTDFKRTEQSHSEYAQSVRCVKN